MNVHTLWVADHIAFSAPVHTHDYYQLIYCHKAGGTLEIGGVHYEAMPGYVYFVRPMVPHGMRRGDDMKVVEIKFLSQDKETEERLKMLPDVFSAADNVAFRRGIRDVVKEGLCEELYCNEVTNAALQMLLLRLLRTFTQNAKEPLSALDFAQEMEKSSLPGKEGEEQFAQLIYYLEKHLDQRITLDDMADMMHFNKSYLVERFKNVLGVPPMRYLNWLRLDKAKELLLTTDKSITDIARETGFQTIHYFSRKFKEKEHTTPQQFRLLHGSADHV